MIFMCATRFEIKEDQLAFIRELAAKDRIDAILEKEIQQDRIEVISDIEEEDEPPLDLTKPIVMITSQRPKRQNSVLSNSSDAKDDLPPQRVSGRIRKRSRLLNGYETEI